MQKGNRRWRALGTFIIITALLGPPSLAGELVDALPPDTAGNYQPAVIPSGWRLTKDGWEHTSTWTLGTATINQLIAKQRNREPAWIRFGFSKLRSIPPLMVAVLQITAIAVITNIAENHRRSLETPQAD